jgi:hypothetical protein
MKNKLMSRLPLVFSLKMSEDCGWMYNGWDKEGKYTDEWMNKTTTFLDYAFSLSKIVRCPCRRCGYKTTIAIHLCKNGFMPGYEV